MTEQEAKNKLIAFALSQVGYAEGANNYNRYAEKWTAAGGWNAQNQPWCDIFADVCFIECFGLDAAARLTYQPKGGFSALCSASANFYKASGAWYGVPAVGDQVFFNVGGGINHTGIVVEVNGARIKTVEGNSSDRVLTHAYTVGDPYVAGYGRPNWSAVASASLATAPAQPGQAQEQKPTEPDHKYHAYTYNVAVSLLKKGDYGPQVKHMQQLLAANGFNPGDIDGEFGERSFNALRDFQRAAGISVDGEWGGESFRAMWNY